MYIYIYIQTKWGGDQCRRLSVSLSLYIYIHLVDFRNKIRELIQFWQDLRNSSIV